MPEDMDTAMGVQIHDGRENKPEDRMDTPMDVFIFFISNTEISRVCRKSR